MLTQAIFFVIHNNIAEPGHNATVSVPIAVWWGVVVCAWRFSVRSVVLDGRASGWHYPMKKLCNNKWIKKCHFRKVIAHILCRFGSRYWNIRSCLRRVAATKSPSSFEIRNMRECWADCSFLRMLEANGPVTCRIELTVPVDSVADWLEKSILVQSHRPHYILYFPLILLHTSLTRCFIIYFFIQLFMEYIQ